MNIIMYVCMHACMYVCLYVYMYVCTYVRMYVCMYVCMHVCIPSFHFEYFYSSSSSPLLLRGAPDYSIDTVLELTRQSATGNSE